MPTILRSLGPVPARGAGRFAVEAEGRILGLLVQDDGGCEFLASSAPAFALNRRRFADVDEAERAIRSALRLA